MIDLINYKYMKYLGVDSQLIDKLRSSKSDERRKIYEAIDHELKDLMRAPNRNHD